MSSGLAVLLLAAAGCGGEVTLQPAPQHALIVVSPHPDDESIFGGATIHRLAADPDWYVHAIYISGGDRATVPGDCNGIPEAQKMQMIVALREGRDTRRMGGVRTEPRRAHRLPARPRSGPGGVVDGRRRCAAGCALAGRCERRRTRRSARHAVAAVGALGPVPDGVDLRRSPRPSHGLSRRAARPPQILRQRQLDVRIWSWIVHDEASPLNMPSCCAGDLHWPGPGPHDNYLALTRCARPPATTALEPRGGRERRDDHTTRRAGSTRQPGHRLPAAVYAGVHPELLHALERRRSKSRSTRRCSNNR